SEVNDATECLSDDDCPIGSECSQYEGNKLCECEHHFKLPNENNGDCSYYFKATTQTKYPEDLRSSTDTSSHQITSNSLDSNLGSDSFSDIGLKIFLPVGLVLVISFIVLLLVLSYRYYRRYYFRGQNCSLVKASEDNQILDKLNVVNRNSSYFETNVGEYGKKWINGSISVDNLRLIEVIGEGAFGQVYKGELIQPDVNETTLVAVKVLKEGVSHEARDDFEREVETMSAFDHDNILKLLGTVSTGNNDTPYMVFEYMMHGDLTEMLRKNEPTITTTDTSVMLQKTDLVDITIQIANGMRYLTSQHFVHRDLATRNCLVGDGLIVKISDFGMSRDIYTCDYYKIGGSRMLPVRWMSPEAVKWGRFTTDSDIWAFGVVLWEIFSYGRQPYYGHTNEEVIRFLDDGILLQRPEECSSIVYHVMLQCWKINPKERLAFDRIHKYLTEYSKQLQNSSKPASYNVVNEYEIPQ
ncbi:tyrosine-protein kinase transmembrane receptor Ror-like, partial [Ruditapes philippinarum]|uniref:tyrosine-protein kinase transmembrane receptor Ror-like n=1 Tax=Ruditapes philippinarum TaxID=129788 RepID=UPI00295B2149